MSAPTLTAPPASRERGADRIAVPFWNGVLSALAAIVLSLVGALIVLIVITIVFIVATGHSPSTNPGGPFVASFEVVVYLFGAAFAWWRLRAIGRNPFRKLTASDMRTVLIGIGGLILVHVATAIQLTYTGQTKHVQSGFEHFTVVGKVPLLTALSIILTVLSAVVLAPIVEEMIFRALLFGAVVRRLGVFAGALVTALLFGAVHGDMILFPTLAALGFIAALAYAATGNLWTSVVLHAVNNALGVTVLIVNSLNKAHH